MRFDDGGEIAIDSDSVGAHHHGGLLAVLVQDLGAHRLAVHRAQLEDMGDLQAFVDIEGFAAERAPLPAAHFPEIEPSLHIDIALDVDAPEMKAVLVGPGHHALSAPQGLIGNNEDLADSHCTQAPGLGAEGGLDFIGASGTQILRLDIVEQFLLHQGIVSAKKHQHDLFVHRVHQGLDLAGSRRAPFHGRQVLDGAHIRGRKFLRGLQNRPLFGGGRATHRFFKIRRIAAGTAGRDPILSRVGPKHELDGLVAPHRARRGLDRHGIEPEPFEDPAIGFEMNFEGAVEAGFIDVHRVGILHGEFTHPEQATLRARLVAKFCLELIPGLGQFLVGPQFAGEVGEDFFVGHPQAHLGPPTILELEHLAAHLRPTPAALPNFARVERGQPEFLGPGPVHLLANDSLDLVEHAMAQGKQRVDPRHQLAHEASANQQLVAHRLGVSGVIAQGGNEDFRPKQRIFLQQAGRMHRQRADDNSRRRAGWPASGSGSRARAQSPRRPPKGESSQDPGPRRMARDSPRPDWRRERCAPRSP